MKVTALLLALFVVPTTATPLDPKRLRLFDVQRSSGTVDLVPAPHDSISLVTRREEKRLRKDAKKKEKAAKKKEEAANLLATVRAKPILENKQDQKEAEWTGKPKDHWKKVWGKKEKKYIFLINNNTDRDVRVMIAHKPVLVLTEYARNVGAEIAVDPRLLFGVKHVYTREAKSPDSFSVPANKNKKVIVFDNKWVLVSTFVRGRGSERNNLFAMVLNRKIDVKNYNYEIKPDHLVGLGAAP